MLIERFTGQQAIYNFVPMKAEEVCRLYSKGQRDFRNADLRGQNFKGHDLSGADFSNADIRGTNFARATLRETNFSGAKAGLQTHGIFLLVAIEIGLLMLAGGACAVGGLILVSTFQSQFIEDYTLIPFIVTTLVLIFLFKEALLEGIESLIIWGVFIGVISVSLAILGVGAIALSQGFAFAFMLGGTVTLSVGLAVFGSIAGFGAGAASIAIVVTGAIGFNLAMTSVGIGSFSVAGTIATMFAHVLAEPLSLSKPWAVVGACIGILPAVFASFPIGEATLSGNPKYAIARSVAINLITIGGTDFRFSNLNGASFKAAIVKSSKFQGASVNQVCWFGATDLSLSQVGDNYLKYPEVRELVVKLSGQDSEFDGLELEGINLKEADLKNASFVGANLNNSDLQNADLSGAKLKQTQLDEVNLSGAILTGAYIEDWGITRTTQLEHVICEYVYMKLPTKNDPDPLRKPDNREDFFCDGDFADFIKPYTDTLDLYHSQKIDPRAISIAFKELSQNNPNADLEIVALEKRGENSLNIKVKTASTANKSQLSNEYFTKYNQLQSLSESRHLLIEKDERIRSLEQMIQAVLNQPSFNFGGDFMPENRETNFRVGGNIDSFSGFVGGDIHGIANFGLIQGNVTNSINQLSDVSHSDLKALLTQLQGAIESDAHLSNPDKADLLEQVHAFTEATQVEEPSKKEGIVRKAMKIFDSTLKSLPDTAKIVEAWSKLLPLILKTLGLT